MGPQENVEVIRRWNDVVNSRDDPGAEFCSPDIEIRNWAESPFPGPYHGHEGLHRWWREVNDADIAEELRLFGLERVIPVDDERVVVIYRASGTARYTGIELDRTWGAVMTLSGGLVTSAVGYPTPEAAMAAAGISEPDDE